MNGKRRVVVGMSGGVDSSVAAWLLRELGYECIGLFMRVGAEAPEDSCTTNRHQGCCSAADALDARVVAGRLSIPFYALNFRDEFEQIIDYFADEYAGGRTPNPCVVCNRDLKFGKLFNYAEAVGADFVATGHYARVEQIDGDWRLQRAVDAQKDQSYVLFPLRREVLGRVLLPLGSLTKPEVRRIAESIGLRVHDKPDSAEICFVPDRDYARVVRARRPEAFAPGEVRDETGNVLGTHGGVGQYTIGQRRGLGIAAGHPVYVTSINVADRAVVVGEREALLSRRLEARGMNWLVKRPRAALRAAAQIRYQHQAAAATIRPCGEDGCEVEFDEPQSAVTPGQAVVLYEGDTVLGGGWIERAFRT